jgi:maleylacetoacetate isomerase
MIRLYDYWRSSASYRVRIALGLAGLEWQCVPVNLVDGDQQSARHLERNPQGLVPVLEIDGFLFTQSLAIIEYLDETRQLGLLPADPVARARVRALSHAIAMEIHPVCNLRVARHAVAQTGGGVTLEGWMRHFISSGLSAFEAMLEGGEYCYGEVVTLADICLMPQLYNAHRWKVDLSAMPKIRRIEETLASIPAIATAHPDKTAQ